MIYFLAIVAILQGLLTLIDGIRSARHMRTFRPLPRKSSDRIRSEEHTSELQSHVNLVCRVLVEKKNGPNGSGKTSFLNVLSGLYGRDAVSCVLGGCEMRREARVTVVRGGVGRTFQAAAAPGGSR